MATSSSNDRLFEPGPRSAMKYYPASGLTFAKSTIPDSPSTTLIVGCDGACPDNGQSPDRASWGIYFGRNSQCNTCGLLPPSSKKTNNVAEIHAAISALKLISQRVILGPRQIKEVVIMSDSIWLINSMTIWLENWKTNGFQSSKKKPVLNSELIQDLDSLIEEIETTQGLHIKFWHVKRKFNSGADRMANIALDNSDIDWELFWKNQLDGEPKAAALDFFTFRKEATGVWGPVLACLEFPLVGKGAWMSLLRAFVILQASWKASCVAGWSVEEKDGLRDRMLEGILGRDWRRRANVELDKWKGKSDAQMELLLGAAKKFREEGDEKKGVFVVRAEVNNHRIMGIISKSLGVSVPFADQDAHYASLAKRYLNEDPKPDTSKIAQPTVPKKAKMSRKSRKAPEPELTESVSGVKLDWGEDWVEVERPETET